MAEGVKELLSAPEQDRRDVFAATARRLDNVAGLRGEGSLSVHGPLACSATARSRHIGRAVGTVAANWPVRNPLTSVRHEHSTYRRRRPDRSRRRRNYAVAVSGPWSERTEEKACARGTPAPCWREVRCVAPATAVGIDRGHSVDPFIRSLAVLPAWRLATPSPQAMRFYHLRDGRHHVVVTSLRSV